MCDVVVITLWLLFFLLGLPKYLHDKKEQRNISTLFWFLVTADRKYVAISASQCQRYWGEESGHLIICDTSGKLIPKLQ